jgi:hypothetical protein
MYAPLRWVPRLSSAAVTSVDSGQDRHAPKSHDGSPPRQHAVLTRALPQLAARAPSGREVASTRSVIYRISWRPSCILSYHVGATILVKGLIALPRPDVDGGPRPLPGRAAAEGAARL